MFGQEEMPLSISEDEEVIHIIEVFLIIYHDLFCQRLWKNLIVKCVHKNYVPKVSVASYHLCTISTRASTADDPLIHPN